MRAVSLLSAGLDSSVALALALERGWKVDLCLTFDYGQRAAAREIGHARAIAEHFRLPHRTLVLPWFGQLARGGGLLKEDEALPRPQPEELSSLAAGRESAKAVWVPNRNGVFLEIGAQLAEDAGAQGVIVGFNAEEAATFPDNSLDYLEALSAALSFSTANRVRVVSPTGPHDKTRIVAEALRTGFPLKLIWSCYEGGERPCRRCESCRRLERALGANGVEWDEHF